MTLYYVENKFYFIKKEGLEYQQADGGCLPILYHSERAAIKRAIKMVDSLKSSGCYSVTLSNEDYPKCEYSLLWATRMEWSAFRAEIRVYKIFTHTKF